MPPSVVKNWMRELEKWGSFAAFSVEAGAGNDGSQAEIFEYLRLGFAEVLVITNR